YDVWYQGFQVGDLSHSLDDGLGDFVHKPLFLLPSLGGFHAGRAIDNSDCGRGVARGVKNVDLARVDHILLPSRIVLAHERRRNGQHRRVRRVEDSFFTHGYAAQDAFSGNLLLLEKRWLKVVSQPLEFFLLDGIEYPEQKE